jgi:hypothetical protein
MTLVTLQKDYDVEGFEEIIVSSDSLLIVVYLTVLGRRE